MGKYSVEDLVTVAKRENNNKRPYLYVNPIQGKHIPVDPSVPLELFKEMGYMLEELYKTERLLLIGFAETATAIGAGIAYYSKNVAYCTQTTREYFRDKNYLYFTESHSHATKQGLIVDGYADMLSEIDRIIFVEDEVTTGNTICKLMEAIKKNFQNYTLKFGIISILNSMSDERIDELNKQGVVCQFIKKIPFEYNIERIRQFNYFNNELDNKNFSFPTIEYDLKFSVQKVLNLRYLLSKEQYVNSVMKYVKAILSEIKINPSIERILVLGTEEYMFPPMMVANALAERQPELLVRFHATTRSPILVSKDDNYPLINRVILKSVYDNLRTTYLYNLDKYDLCIVLSDASVEFCMFEDIIESMSKYGCRKFYISGKEIT